MIGIGAMIEALSGGHKVEPELYMGKVVERGQIVENQLHLALEGGGVLTLWDNAQSCCEHRHMSCDDNLADIFGGRLIAIEVEDGPDLESSESHEQQFLIIKTTEGTITVANHNEHNGYYGGFGLAMSYKGPSA